MLLIEHTKLTEQ